MHSTIEHSICRQEAEFRGWLEWDQWALLDDTTGESGEWRFFYNARTAGAA